MNAIAAAVEPLRSQAVARAQEFGVRVMDAVRARLEEADWDINAAAPYPTSAMGRKEYVMAKARRTRFEMLTKPLSRVQSFRGPCIVEWSPEMADKFMRDAAEDASLEFDLFTAKLTEKVGEVVDASLAGDLWQHSLLTVTKPDGSVERWRTQQIINVSSLGKLFNQWPTRKVK